MGRGRTLSRVATTKRPEKKYRKSIKIRKIGANVVLNSLSDTVRCGAEQAYADGNVFPRCHVGPGLEVVAGKCRTLFLCSLPLAKRGQVQNGLSSVGV